jgi:hypothetical protein
MPQLLSALHGVPSLLCGYPAVPAALGGCGPAQTAQQILYA